MDMTS